MLNEGMSACVNAGVHPEPNSDVLHKHGMNLTSVKDALWCLPFLVVGQWGRGEEKAGADTFHLSHSDENRENQD